MFISLLSLNSKINVYLFIKATFTYWVIAHGWHHANGEKPNLENKPKKVVVARCDGPDAGYVATSGCILSSALTILEDKNSLPEKLFFFF